MLTIHTLTHTQMCICWGQGHTDYPARCSQLSHTITPLLKEPGDQPVRHGVGVALPVFAVFAAAAVLVADAAVNQQNGHVDDVEVREEVSEAAGGAVGQRSHQVAGVVEVARHSPEP